MSADEAPKMPAGESPAPQEMALEWHVPDTIVSRYATHVVIQRAENEVFLLFFEVSPPIVLSPLSEGHPLPTAHAECFARIILAPQKLTELVTVLQRTLAQGQQVDAVKQARQRSQEED